MTELKKITIHRALTELKMLHNRIDSATQEVTAVVANRKSNTKINGIDIDEFESEVDTVLSESNATTFIEVQQ